MAKKSQKIEDLLAEGLRELRGYRPTARARPGQPTPPRVSNSRIVCLSPEEHARLQRAADEANLPVPAVMRVWAMDRLRAEERGGDPAVS